MIVYLRTYVKKKEKRKGVKWTDVKQGISEQNRTKIQQEQKKGES